MPSFNKYLYRALRKDQPAYLQHAGSAAKGTLRYFDRLLGLSANKMRVRADTARHAASLSSDPKLQSLATVYNSRAKRLTSQSTSTRIKTGLGLGAAFGINKAFSDYKTKLDQEQAFNSGIYPNNSTIYY